MESFANVLMLKPPLHEVNTDHTVDQNILHDLLWQIEPMAMTKEWPFER